MKPERVNIGVQLRFARMLRFPAFVFMLMAGLIFASTTQGLEQSAMIVILPDTQNYVEWKRSGVTGQFDWIAAHQQSSNIVFVGHVGDVVNDYDTNPDQWSFMQREYKRLAELNLPYAVVPGNHDYRRGERDSTMMNSYFPLSSFTSMPTYGGAYDSLCDNTWHLVPGPGRDWLIMNLEFGPREAVIAWANEVLGKHDQQPAILITHAYLNKQGERFVHDDGHAASNGYGLGRDVNDGLDIWNKLVYSNSQVRLVVCGHDGAADVGARLRVGTNISGHAVCEVMTNYQYYKDPVNSGYMLLVDLSTDGTASFRTFSPTLEKDYESEGAFGELDLSGF